MRKRLPPWMARPLTEQKGASFLAEEMRRQHVPTVCEHALCPNRQECFAKKRATFLALGSSCTRKCAFCHIHFSAHPPPPDPDEPKKIASWVKKLNLSHAVITMVTRDDLVDGGASHMASIVREIHEQTKATIEVLTSDFQGNTSSLETLLKEKIDIFNHNLETVEELSIKIRSTKANYRTSLSLLEKAKNHRLFSGKIKSGLMVGLGEKKEQVEQTLRDLHSIGCDIVTIGQYLQPSKKQMVVQEYVPLETFQAYEDFGLSLGLPFVFANPFVRSSFHAEEVMQKTLFS